MKIKEIKIVNQDQSTEVADIGADAINVDYNDTTVKAELDKLNNDIDTNTTNISSEIATRANAVTSLQSQINTLASGSPKGVYATTTALINANPNTGVYIVTENGHIYSWTKNGSSAIDLGVYQATGIGDGTVLLEKMDSLQIKEYFFECDADDLGWEAWGKNVVYSNPSLFKKGETIELTDEAFAKYDFGLLYCPSPRENTQWQEKAWSSSKILTIPETGYYKIKLRQGTDTSVLLELPSSGDITLKHYVNKEYANILTGTKEDAILNSTFAQGSWTDSQNRVSHDHTYLTNFKPVIFDKPVRITNPTANDDNYYVAMVKYLDTNRNLINQFYSWIPLKSSEIIVEPNIPAVITFRWKDTSKPVDPYEINNFKFSYITQEEIVDNNKDFRENYKEIDAENIKWASYTNCAMGAIGHSNTNVSSSLIKMNHGGKIECKNLPSAVNGIRYVVLNKDKDNMMITGDYRVYANTNNTFIMPIDGYIRVSFNFPNADSYTEDFLDNEHVVITDGYQYYNNNINLNTCITKKGGNNVSTTSRLWTDYILVGKGTEISLFESFDFRVIVDEYGIDKGSIISSHTWTGGTYAKRHDKIVIENDGYIKIGVAYHFDDNTGHNTLIADDIPKIMPLIQMKFSPNSYIYSNDLANWEVYISANSSVDVKTDGNDVLLWMQSVANVYQNRSNGFSFRADATSFPGEGQTRVINGKTYLVIPTATSYVLDTISKTAILRPRTQPLGTRYIDLLTNSGGNASSGIFLQRYLVCNSPLKQTVSYETLMNDRYFPEAWSSRVNDIQHEQKNCFTFGVQTDTHITYYDEVDETGRHWPVSGEGEIVPLKMMTKYIGFDYICNLGDIIRGYDMDNIDHLRKSLTKVAYKYVDGCECPVLFAIGNHEDGSMWTLDQTGRGSGNQSVEETMRKDELFAKTLSFIKNKPGVNMDYNNTNLYYYVDYKDVRVIVLNTHDVDWTKLGRPDGMNVNTHIITETQIDWLENIALDTNKPVIIMCHVPLINSTLKTETLINQDACYQKIVNFKNNGGTVIGCFYGHTHAQNAEKDENGINHIVFKNGGTFAEIVMVDLENRSIQTRMVGSYGTLVDRQFTY